MFIKYFNFQDENHSLYPLSQIKSKGALSKSETQMPNKYYVIRISIQEKDKFFYYKNEALRDKVYNSIKKLKGIKD